MSRRFPDSIQPTECPLCDGTWASAEPDALSVGDKAEAVVVDVDQFRKHLGHHLQQIALFSLPRQNREDDAGSKDVAPVDDGDTAPQGWTWERQDSGRGWSIVFSKRATLTALASFLDLYISRRQHRESLSTDLFEVGLDDVPDHLKRVEDGWSIVYKSKDWLTLGVNLVHTMPQGMPTLALRFSLDGQCIANASFSSVNVFDVITGALSHTLMLPSEEAAVYAVWFNPDGDRIVAGDSEGFVTVSEAFTSSSGSRKMHLLTICLDLEYRGRGGSPQA
jgi:WD40 repeat protein